MCSVVQTVMRMREFAVRMSSESTDSNSLPHQVLLYTILQLFCSLVYLCTESDVLHVRA